MLTTWYWMRTYVLIGNHTKMMHRKSHNHKLGHNLLMALSGKVSYEDVQTPWLENMVENDRWHWFVFHFTIVDRSATLSQSFVFSNAKEVYKSMIYCYKKKLITSTCHNGRYSHFVPISTLRRSNSEIVLRKVRIPTTADKVRILTLHKTIPELYRFLLCAEHIYISMPSIENFTLSAKR